MTDVDMRIQSPCSILLAGMSKSGKTTLAMKMIENRKTVFTNGEKQGAVYVFYREYQSLFDDYSHVVTEFIQGKCSMDWLKKMSSPTGDEIITVLIDDLAMDKSAVEEASSMFAVGGHHLHANVLFLTQNLFSKNPFARDLSLNASNVIIFRNPRDKSQIFHFAKQIHPSAPRVIRQMFEQATKDPYSYLSFDTTQARDEKYRIVSHLFSEDGNPPRVYILNNY